MPYLDDELMNKIEQAIEAVRVQQNMQAFANVLQQMEDRKPSWQKDQEARQRQQQQFDIEAGDRELARLCADFAQAETSGDFGRMKTIMERIDGISEKIRQQQDAANTPALHSEEMARLQADIPNLEAQLEAMHQTGADFAQIQKMQALHDERVNRLQSLEAGTASAPMQWQGE